MTVQWIMSSEEENSLTIDGTPVNKYKEFVKCAITHFHLMTATELSWAKSKDNVTANKYLTDAIHGELIQRYSVRNSLGKISPF